MGVNINKRIFGSDLPLSVKQKLALRQALNQTSDFGEAVTMVEDNIVETIDMNQFNFSGNGEVIADLSSRTPFARMWTAVEIRTHSNVGVPQTADDIGKPGKDEIHVKIDNKIQKKVVIHNERMVYEVGNYINSEFNIFDSETSNRRQNEEKGFNSTNITSKDITSKDIIPNIFETNENRFMKPEAGITSITSGTEGSLGSIKKTTVNFVVHNFHDYDKIYSRYFMRPGAQIFVDFGWDAIKTLYDPRKVVDNTSDLYQDHPKGRGTNIEDILFGEYGYVTESEGDLETLIGVVTSFDSKIKANGSVECSLEIISKNAALIHGTVDTKLKNRIMYLLDAEIMNYAAKYFKDFNLLNTDWTNSSQSINDYNKVAQLFAASNLKGSNSYPTKYSLVTSVYWLTGINAAGEPIPGNTKNIYISWGLFEDKILNGQFGVGGDIVDILGYNKKGGNFETSFDSSDSFITFNENLEKRQNNESDPEKIFFIYPKTWGSGPKTYNIKYNKVPARTGTIVDEKFIYDKDKPIIDAIWGNGQFGKFEKYDKDNNKIPLREVFISLKVIKDGFKDKGTETISDALNYILNKINEDSFNVFNLKLVNNRQDNVKLSVVDYNLLNITNDDDDDFDKLFTFKPMSPNSIVKSYDLSITTPKNELQSMLAIQSLPSGKSIFPLSAVVDKYLAMNMTSQDNTEVGVVYLPEIGSYQSDKMDSDNALESSISFNFNETNTSPDSKSSNIMLNTMASEFIVENAGEVEAAISTAKNPTESVIGVNIDSKDTITSEQYEASKSNNRIASTFAEYYGFLAQKNIVGNLPTVIPATLSLSIYGISSLVPGDIFKVDYLPERQRKLLYFQVTKVTHNVSSTSWTTQLETVPRIRSTKKIGSGVYHIPNNILISKKLLTDIFDLKNITMHNNNLLDNIIGLKIEDVPENLAKLGVDYIFDFKSKSIGGKAWTFIGIPVNPFVKKEDSDDKGIDIDEYKIESIDGGVVRSAANNDVNGSSLNEYRYQFDVEDKKTYKIMIRGSYWVAFPPTASSNDYKLLFEFINKYISIKDLRPPKKQKENEIRIQTDSNAEALEYKPVQTSGGQIYQN